MQSKQLFFPALVTFVIGVGFLGCHGTTYSKQYKELMSVPADIPLNATTVDVSNNRTAKLTSGVFAHLSVCMRLDLSKNHKIRIERGAFTGLIALTELDLTYNEIARLEEDVIYFFVMLESVK